MVVSSSLLKVPGVEQDVLELVAKAGLVVVCKQQPRLGIESGDRLSLLLIENAYENLDKHTQDALREVLDVGVKEEEEYAVTAPAPTMKMFDTAVSSLFDSVVWGMKKHESFYLERSAFQSQVDMVRAANRKGETVFATWDSAVRESHRIKIVTVESRVKIAEMPENVDYIGWAEERGVNVHLKALNKYNESTTHSQRQVRKLENHGKKLQSEAAVEKKKSEAAAKRHDQRKTPYLFLKRVRFIDVTFEQFRNTHLSDYLKKLKQEGKNVSTTGSFPWMAKELKRIVQTIPELEEEWNSVGGAGGPS
jgi:hypothetical protein